MGKRQPPGLTNTERSGLAGERAPVRPGLPASILPSPGERMPPSAVPTFGRLLASSGLRDGDLPERDATPLRGLDP